MFKTIKQFSCYLFLLLPILALGQANTLHVIPQPNQITLEEGSFKHNGKLTLAASDDALGELLEYASEALKDNFNGEGTMEKGMPKLMYVSF